MKKRHIIIFLVVVILLITITAMSAPFRFYPTHMIVKQVNCFSCHIDELEDLEKGRHIRMMNTAQNKTLFDYLSLYGNSNDSYKTLEGPCYSCHVTYKNFHLFGLTDPYAYSIGNRAYQVNNLVKEIDTINAQYGYIIEWPVGREYSTTILGSSSNASIHVELEIMSVSPPNFSVDSEIKIVMANYSGEQYDTTCDCTQILYEGETQVVDVTNIYDDYFKVILILDGLWNNTLINLRVNNTDKGLESFFIMANRHPYVHESPLNDTGIYYFKTNGTHKAIRLDYIWAEWRGYTMGNIASSEIIETSNTDGWVSEYTCSAPDAMCHINQKATYIGLSDGISPDKRLYSHSMDSVTSKECKLCHLK